MKKQRVVEIFQKSHKMFSELIHVLTPFQLTGIKVLEDWTVKDVIAHLSAWNWEQTEEIDNILRNKPTWSKKYKAKKDQDNFNKKAVEGRKNKSIQIVIDEWDRSFQALVKRIEKLTEEEWDHKGMVRLFRYEKTGLSDEGHHAKQIKKFLKIQ